jgi:RecA/RadA recombinase
MTTSTKKTSRRVKREAKADGTDAVTSGKVPPPSDPPVSARSRKLSKAVRSIEGFQIWADLAPPLICPTRVTSLNRGMKCGGIPGGMLGVLHGPSQGGKTLLLAEILYDAWATGGWGLFVDAECRGVDLKWFAAICGDLSEVAYYKPRTYEECISKIEEFRGKFRKAKEAGDLPAGAFLAVGIDSVNRLTPSTELEELLKGTVAARGYPIRAMMTSRWLDKIIPTLERDEILVFIQRESQKLDAMPGQKQYTVKGGSAPIYDGGWICRVTAAGRVKAELKGKDDKVLVGEKHEVEIVKNSLGPHLNETAWFYSSVGATDQTPLGLDLIREVREEAIHRGVARYVSGKGYLLRDEVVAPSKAAFLEWLREDENWLRSSMTSSESRPEPAERLALFIRACNYGGDLGRMDAYEVRSFLLAALSAADLEPPEEDRRLLKLAAAAVAFHREIRRVVTEEPQLDFREEEILRAVLTALGEGVN